MATAAPAYQRTNILVGQASCFIPPYSSATPAALPPISQGLNVAWASPWVPVGATEKGLDFKYARKVVDVTVEEQMTPVAVPTKNLDWSLDLQLSEDTLQTMKTSFGGGTITQVAASGTPGQAGYIPPYETFQISQDVQQLAFGFEQGNEYGLPRRCLVPVVVAAGTIDLKFQRADAQHMYMTSFRVLCDPTTVLWQNVKPGS